MFIFNINSIFIILICIYLLISNILLRKKIKKLINKTDSEIGSLHIRANNLNYSIGSINSRMNTVQDGINYLYRHLR